LKDHDPVYKKGCLCKLPVGGFKLVPFVILRSKGADHHKAVQGFPRDPVQAIHQVLHHFEFWHNKRNKRYYKADKNDNRKDDDPGHARGMMYRHDNPADSHNRGVTDHADSHYEDALHLVDVVGTAGNKGCRGKGIEFTAGETFHLFKNGETQITGDSGGNPGRKKTHAHRRRAPCQRDY